MSTVKEILDAFCYRSNLPAYASYVGSTAPAQAQYLELLSFIGNNLRDRAYNWPELKRSYTFTTTLSTSNYQLPGDFYRMLPGTQFDDTNNWALGGPASDFSMAYRSFGVTSTTTHKFYRIIGPTNYLYSTSPYSRRSAGYFQINPAGINGTDIMYMEYISSNWVWPRDWVTNLVYAAGDIRTGVANIYRTAAGGTSGATRPSWTTGSSTDGTVTWTVYNEPYVATNDSDLVLFDKDLMVEGMRWAFLDAKDLNYGQRRTDWENQVRSLQARAQGYIRVNAADEFSYSADWPNMQAGSWDWGL